METTMNENLKETDVKIETASEDDAKELLDIYAPYILETAITFEYTIPSVDEFRERIRSGKHSEKAGLSESECMHCLPED